MKTQATVSQPSNVPGSPLLQVSGALVLILAELLYKRTRLRPPAFCVPTFPSWRPQRAIDHILLSEGLRGDNARAMPAANSDHLALAMDIDVPHSALR